MPSRGNGEAIFNPLRLALVGASVRSAAHSALRAGFHPLGADLFADADLKSGGPWQRIVDYPEGLARWLDTVECDGWIYTGGLENYPRQIAEMAARHPLLGCGGELLKAVRSPGKLAAVLEENGLRFPETIPLSSPLAFPDAENAERWLLKTCLGSSGGGVRSLTDFLADRSQGNPTPWAREEAPGKLPRQDGYLQQRIDGESHAGLFFAHAGQTELLGLTRQLVGETWTGAAPFQYCGSIGPPPRLPDGLLAEVERIGKVLATMFGLVGLFGVDLILAVSQVWTLEVNPRYTASAEIVERITGEPVLARHLLACRSRRGEQGDAGKQIGAFRPVRSSGCHGKAILFARQRVTIGQEFTRWALGKPYRTGWPQWADIPRPETVIQAGQPVITLFATGDSAAEVEGALRERVAQTERKLYVC